MKKRNKILANILMYATLLVPMPVYLLIMATFFSVKADYTVSGVDIADLSVFVADDEYYINSSDNAVIYDGLVAYNVDLDNFVMIVDEGDIVRVGKKLYNLEFDDEVEEFRLIEIDVKKIKKEQKTKYDISIFGMIAIVIVALIIIKKMQLEKKYPRIAVMIALSLGTAILYGINTIVSDMLYVFVVATVSWAIYLIEYTVYFNKLNANEKAMLIAKLENKR